MKLILLLLGEISRNPRPIQNNHLKESWEIIRNRGLHFIRLNKNSLLPKIDELREIGILPIGGTLDKWDFS